jgi:hypothetical protein
MDKLWWWYHETEMKQENERTKSHTRKAKEIRDKKENEKKGTIRGWKI